MADQPIIIKRIKKGGHAHHGGAWKLAYADFVTAMMAFFLLLWLLNAVTEEQLQGIADYFAPTTVSDSSSGAGGILGGKVVGQGAQESNGNPPSFSLSLPPPSIGSGGDVATNPKEGFSDQDKEGLSDKNGEGLGEKPGIGPSDKQGQAAAPPSPNQQVSVSPPGQQQSGPAQQINISQQQAQQLAAQAEQQQFQQAQQALKQAINSIPELAKLADSLMVDNTPEGLRIQIVDQDGLAMFPSGSADMYGHTRALIDLVARVIKKLPEKISISGNTDATPFVGQTNYTNWELSADRALATRRVLLGAGVPEARIDRVVGRGPSDPLLPKDPTNARNRRLSIVLLRDTAAPPVVNVTPDAARAGQVPAQLQSAPPPPAQAAPAAAPQGAPPPAQ
jgi:chemotaxis protein MotB